ncbi:hypothetical protein ACU4GR_29720, partial [Methylobacterium oryzae CBMB20]
MLVRNLSLRLGRILVLTTLASGPVSVAWAADPALPAGRPLRLRSARRHVGVAALLGFRAQGGGATVSVVELP